MGIREFSRLQGPRHPELLFRLVSHAQVVSKTTGARGPKNTSPYIAHEGVQYLLPLSFERGVTYKLVMDVVVAIVSVRAGLSSPLWGWVLAAMSVLDSVLGLFGSRWHSK